jgi:hypothetical protein
MSTLREFIANRKSEVDLQIKGLRKELAEIALVERALDGEAPEEAAPEAPPSKPARAGGKLNLKDMTLEVLRSAPNGMAAEAILETIGSRYDVEVAADTLSALLLRLGGEQVVIDNGFAWCLAPAKGEPSETAEAPAAAAGQPISLVR